MSTLRPEIESIITASGATAMGVAIKHLESGAEIYINADQPFPLCSVFKIPVLAEAFHQIEQGRFTLDDRWELTLAEKNLPSGILVFLQDGLMPTVRDLLTLMIIISDNTATDMVMHRLGVPNTTQFMHELGLTDIHVPMTVRDIFNDIMGEAGSDPRLAFTNLGQPQKEEPSNRNGHAYSLGPDNDVGTPRALNRLVELIFQGEVVSRTACDQMLHILLQQQLNLRLPRFLPEGTPVAHKTGTLGGIRNDSGIIYCNDHAHVAVTVFCTWDAAAVKDDPVAEWDRVNALDSAFGHIGRLVYQQFK
ncbi:MAG: class A beta-lactamase-related serine hydrolase [Chloroflexi bacterium]|nr:class A beta-lactamase-related serine hydrolase [Chloroflexota bacterium]